MISSATQRRVMRALLWTHDPPTEEDIAFLNSVAESGFATLKWILDRVSQEDLASMRKNLEQATKDCDDLVKLEKDRGCLGCYENSEVFLPIEREIETCLETIDKDREILRKSMFKVGDWCNEMRGCFRVYDKLFVRLEDRSKVQFYRDRLTELEKEYDDCSNHPIFKLSIDVKSEKLLCHLRRSRACSWTRADVMEGIGMYHF